MICLVLERAGLSPVMMTFTQPVVVVGRRTCEPGAPRVDWSLTFPDVSRQQCRFTRVGEEVLVEGLTPRNPIFVDGQAVVGRRALALGDQVCFGGCSLRLVERDAPAAGPRVEASGDGDVSGDMYELAARARRWAESGRPPGLLLRGQWLRRGLAWARSGADEGPSGMALRRFVALSADERRTRRQRLAARGGLVVVALGAGVVAADVSIGAELPPPAAPTRGWTDACSPTALARAEAVVKGAERERGSVDAAALAGLALRIADDGGCASQGRAEAALRAELTELRGVSLGTLSGPARALAGDPGGRWIAAADPRGGVLVWDVLGAAAAVELPAGEPASALAFSADGRWLAAGGEAGELRLWDTRAWEREPLRRVGHRDAITGLALVGGALASGDRRGELRLWRVPEAEDEEGDRGEGRRDLRLWRGGEAVEAPRRGRREAGSEEGSVEEAARESGLRRGRPPQGQEEGFGVPAGEAALAVAPAGGAGLTDLVFEADSGRIAALAGGQVRVWQARGGRLKEDRVEAEVPLTSFALRPGALVTGDAEGEVVSRGRRGGPVTLTRHAVEVVAVRALPGAVASLSRDGELRVADVDAPLRADGTSLVHVFAGGQAARGLVVDASGSRALAIGAELVLWDVGGRWGEPVVRLPGAEAGAFAVGGAWAAVAGAEGGLWAWDMRADGAGLGGYALAEQGPWRALAVAGGGTAVASAGRTGEVSAWRLEEGGAPRMKASWRAPRPVELLALSEDGRWLAGASGAALRVWDLAAPEREPSELVGPLREIEALRFGGAWLVAADLEEVFMWRVDAGGPAEVGTEARPPGEVWALATSAEHVAIGTGSPATLAGGRVYAWPLGEAWRPEALVAEHARPVTALVFAPSGVELASGSADGGVRAAALEEGRWRATRPHDHGQAVRELAFGTSDAAPLAVGGADGVVVVYAPRGAGAPRRIAAHTAAITGLAFGADPSRLVSASRGGELALWRIGVDVEEVARVQHHRPLVELLGGGRQVVAADDAAGVRVWPLDPAGLLRLACVAVGRDARAEAQRRMLAWPPRPLCSEG